mgnify:FL=1
MELVYLMLNTAYLLLGVAFGVDVEWLILSLMAILGFQITTVLLVILKELKKK